MARWCTRASRGRSGSSRTNSKRRSRNSTRCRRRNRTEVSYCFLVSCQAANFSSAKCVIAAEEVRGMKSASMLAVILAFVCCFSGLRSAQAQTPDTHTLSPGSSGETLTANEIMARVAANQDRSQEARKQYIYRQQIHVALNRTNGKLVRQEDTDYRLVPQADKTERKLEKITGKYWKKGKYEQFSGEPIPDGDHLDAELVNEMREDLVEPKSKDGIGQNLVPFSSEKLKKHV